MNTRGAQRVVAGLNILASIVVIPTTSTLVTNMDWNQYTTQELHQIAQRHYLEVYGAVHEAILNYNRDLLITLLGNLERYAHAVNKHFSDGLED